MKKSDKEDILSKIDTEGFDYCFINYSRFPQIKDKQFHILRENYIKSHKELSEYIELEY